MDTESGKLCFEHTFGERSYIIGYSQGDTVRHNATGARPPLPPPKLLHCVAEGRHDVVQFENASVCLSGKPKYNLGAKIQIAELWYSRRSG